MCKVAVTGEGSAEAGLELILCSLICLPELFGETSLDSGLFWLVSFREIDIGFSSLI